MIKSSTSKGKRKAEIKLAETQIGERLKELQFFFSLSGIIERVNITLDEIYQELVNILPKSWKYSEVAYARLVIGNIEFCTENYIGSKWIQSAPINVRKRVVGRIEVGYIKEMPEQEEGPFLKEERQLLETTAERLGHITERKQAEQELIIANKELAFQNNEKQKRADELIIANKELAFQNKEKEKRAEELIIANKELAFQNKEKEKRAEELILANKELAFQNKEKEKRAEELIIANKELQFQNEKKKKKAARLIIANERNRETNEYLEKLLNYANSPIIVWDKQFNITRFNKAFESITGRTEKDMIGKSVKILFPTVNRESSMELLKKTIAGERLEVAEINILHLDGSIRILLWNSANIMSRDRLTIIATIAQGHDITKRKLAEEVIKDNEKRFRELIESLPQLFWTCRIDGPCDYLSKQWVEYTGVPEAEQLGYRWLEQLHPEDKDKTVSEWMEKVKTGNSFDVEFRIRRNDGVYHWFKTTAVPMHDAEGNIIKWFGSNTEIDEIKKAEKQLRKLNRIYSLLSDINQAIVRTREPNELFEKVCNIAVEQGGFGMAWIGLVDKSSQKLRVIAQASRTNDYHEQVNISLNGEPLSYCPIDNALRQGKHNICNIIENEEVAPCQKIAYELGFHSSASFPLQVFDILQGALTLYSGEPEFFDEEELKLLDELALDISFAMEYAKKEVERKQGEVALKTSEERFRIAAENLTDVVYDWDIKEKVDWYGDIDGITGYPQGGFPRTIGGWAATIHPEDKDYIMAALEDHVKGVAPYLVEYRVMNKEGVWRWWSARGTALRDDQGKPFKMIGSITDITNLKLATRNLKEREARYKTLVENIPQKILMKGIDYRWISINKNLARDFSISPEEIVGKLDHDLFPRELADKYHADDVRIITTGKTEELEEKYIVDGKETWVNTIKTPVRDNKGEIVGLLGIFWDITERKLAVEEIRRLNAELEQRVLQRTAQLDASNKELEAFTYSVSHDLRAPLRHISGYVDLLSERFHDSLSEKGKHYLDSIADSTKQMGKLIDDLLQFSRSGRQEMQQANLDMNDLLQEALNTVKQDLSGRSIEWVIARLPHVFGDHNLLILVWINLLSNAVKFTRAKDKVRIETGFREENNQYLFFVRDNGAGFDMQYAHKLFGVFQRLHSSEEFEGTGIGLANVRRIILKHGGRTWAEAELEKGATFYFTLPKKN